MMNKFKGLTAMACAFAITGELQAGKPKAGTIESELIIQGGILDSVAVRLARKKENLEVYRRYQEVAAEIAQATATLDSIKKEIAALEAKKIVAGDEFSLAQLMFEDYRDRYRESERQAAEGEILDLSETKGDSYQECKVLGISALHLRISRPTGAEGIPFKELPVSIQDRFQFSNEEAAEFAAKMAKSDVARALAYNQLRNEKRNLLSDASIPKENERLAQLELLAKNTHDESARLRKESDEWREKAARYWKSIGAASSQSGRKSRESLASRAEAKADQYFELSRAARFEADRIDGEIHDLKAQIKAED